MAPDPYNQFHSPYIAMANNPVNAVDPSGGYTFVDNTAGQTKSRNYLRMQEDKANGTGAFDWEHTKARYEDKVNTWADKCGMNGTTEFYSNPRQAERFLEGLKTINAEYMGLGFSGSMLENGGDYLNSQESTILGNERSSLNAFNGAGGGTSLRGMTGEDGRGWTMALGADDPIMSSVNAYDQQEAEKKALWGDEYVERQALQGGGLLRAMDKISEAISTVANKVGDAISGLFERSEQRSSLPEEHHTKRLGKIDLSLGLAKLIYGAAAQGPSITFYQGEYVNYTHWETVVYANGIRNPEGFSVTWNLGEGERAWATGGSLSGTSNAGPFNWVRNGTLNFNVSANSHAWMIVKQVQQTDIKWSDHLFFKFKKGNLPRNP